MSEKSMSSSFIASMRFQSVWSVWSGFLEVAFFGVEFFIFLWFLLWQLLYAAILNKRAEHVQVFQIRTRIVVRGFEDEGGMRGRYGSRPCF